MIVQLIGTGEVIPLSPDEMWCSYTLCTGTYIYDVIAIMQCVLVCISNSNVVKSMTIIVHIKTSFNTFLINSSLRKLTIYTLNYLQCTNKTLNNVVYNNNILILCAVTVPYIIMQILLLCKLQRTLCKDKQCCVRVFSSFRLLCSGFNSCKYSIFGIF